MLLLHVLRIEPFQTTQPDFPLSASLAPALDNLLPNLVSFLLSFKNLNWNSKVNNYFSVLAFIHSLAKDSMQTCLLSERKRE